MNILIIAPLQTYPTDHGSKKRILELGMYFKKLGHTANFVYLKHKYEILDDYTIDKMFEQWDTLNVIHIEKFLEKKLIHYPLDYLYEDHIGKSILEITKNLCIDMVLVNYIYYSKIFEILPSDIIKVLDTIDKFTDRNIMLENAKIDKSQWWFSLTKHDEEIGLNRADIILAIQNDEKEFFESICHKKVLLINHIEYKKFIEQLSYKNKLILGFIGSNNGSNISSINNFINKFIILVDEFGLNIELHIAGKVCNYIEKNHKNIKKLYFLKDTSDFFKGIHLFVNPLNSGTGLKIKSVEALSYGVPIISTKIGFEGIESNSKFHKIEDINEMMQFLKEINNDCIILKELSDRSKNIFEKYICEIHNNILKILICNNNLLKEKLTQDFIKNYNVLNKYKIRYEALSYKYETNVNLTFSIWINKLYSQINSIVEKNDKVVLYGFGHIGKIIYNKYKDNILYIVDKKAEGIYEKEDVKINSIDYLKFYNNEVILISVLGREEEISEYLFNNFNINKNKIISINFKQDEYT